MTPLTGMCECGCGNHAPLARQTDTARGYVKGAPVRFIYGHNISNGGRAMDRGYVLLRRPDHPSANRHGYVREYRLLAEAALGCELPPGAVVHHANGSKADNRNRNLVVCENNTYHLLLHHRERALHESGNTSALWCRYCESWDDPGNMYVRRGTRMGRHRKCHARHEKRRLENAR